MSVRFYHSLAATRVLRTDGDVETKAVKFIYRNKAKKTHTQNASDVLTEEFIRFDTRVRARPILGHFKCE